MTKSLVTASITAMLALAACGGGEGGAGGGGGGGGEPPSGDAVAQADQVVECLKKEKATAKVDKADAKLIRAPKAAEAVVAEVDGATANVFFFAAEEDAAKANDKVKDSKLSNREDAILIVYDKEPDGSQKSTIEDCLPGAEEEEKSEK